MPQASDKLRRQAYYEFGERDTASEALAYLNRMGWKTWGGWLTPPRSDECYREWLAVEYLVQEWDYAVKTKEKP